MSLIDKTPVEVALEAIEKDVQRVENKVDTGFREMKDVIRGGYVKKEEFEPVKKIVYGLVGLVLTSFVGAVIALIIK